MDTLSTGVYNKFICDKKVFPQKLFFATNQFCFSGHLN